MKHRYTQLTHPLKISSAAVAAIATTVSLVVLDVLPASSRAVHPEAERDVVGQAYAAVAMAERANSADASEHAMMRWQDDLAALQVFRPGFSFWQHIFTIPDGSIAFGSAVDGRLIAVFPAKGDWVRQGVWTDPSLPSILNGRTLSRDLDKRRDEVASLLELVVGPVVHNATRGQFLAPSARRYSSFLQEWGSIYERFGVPAEVGLAQAVIESGLSGTRKSEANAIGFCQWLTRNWKVLDRLSPNTIEAENQTTQAPYCAAYLTILATKHGSFIPALSEHHSGGTNVARTLINGERLGGGDTRERYFMGSQLARDLRLISSGTYSDLYRTYGPRSYRYAEMTFGNIYTVETLRAAHRQVKIYAMRTPRAIALAELTRRTGLSADEVKRFNPALVKRVPAGATLYLPMYVKEFGRDVTFWHRPASAGYLAALHDFMRLDAAMDQWDDPAFARVLRSFEQRFRETKTEEGAVMATVLAYAIQEMYSSGRGAILDEFRTSEQIRQLFDRAVREREAVRIASAGGNIS